MTGAVLGHGRSDVAMASTMYNDRNTLQVD